MFVIWLFWRNNFSKSVIYPISGGIEFILFPFKSNSRTWALKKTKHN